MSTSVETVAIRKSPLLDSAFAAWTEYARDATVGHAISPVEAQVRAARRAHLETLGSAEQLQVLAGHARGIVLPELFGAVLDTRDGEAPSHAAPELLRDLARRLPATKGVDATRTYLADGESAARLTAVHEASVYTSQRRLNVNPRVVLWPSPYMEPAPSGKVARLGEEGGEPVLHLGFGDTGQVGRGGGLSWPQWYRLGIWHALLRGAWADPLEQAFAAEKHALDRRLNELPAEARRIVGAHDFSLKRLDSWPSYFGDRLIAAGKVLLEHEVAGEESAQEQVRWLRSLGRFDLDWFVQALEPVGDLTQVDLPALAREWALSVATETSSQAFQGPLAACENPVWNDGTTLVFGPSVDRAVRRALQVWFRSYWPVQPMSTEAEPGGVDWEQRPRLVFGLASDRAWAAPLLDNVTLREVGGSVESVACLLEREQPFGIVFAAAHAGTPSQWSRIVLANDVELLQRAHGGLRYYSDWTAFERGARRSGRAVREADGSLSLIETRSQETEHP